MSYEKRLEIYTKIEEIRSRPLVCYVTSIRQNASAIIAADVIPELIKQINAIPPEKKEVDFLVVSNGGDGITAARIISLLRERFNKVGVLLPYAAYSAATLLAMGADEIIMHPFSNLGPVDPQLKVTRKRPDGNLEEHSYGTEDLRNYFTFVKQEVGLNDQEQMAKAFEMLCNEVGAIPIGIAKRSAHLTVALGERLLSLHMQDASKVKVITETLSRSYHHHGYPLARSDAEKVGLPVQAAESDVEQLIWQVWEDLEEEMECNKPFDPLELVLSSSIGESLLKPIPQLQIPSNLPQEMLQAVYTNVMQNHVKVEPVEPVDYSLFMATLESNRCRSENRVKGKLFASRLPDTNIHLNGIQTFQGWTFYRN